MIKTQALALLPASWCRGLGDLRDDSGCKYGYLPLCLVIHPWLDGAEIT